MGRHDPVIGIWNSENAPGFPPPTQVFKYKRIPRKRPTSAGKTHTMCLPPLVRIAGCYLWFHMSPFQALRTGKAENLSDRLRQYDSDEGFSRQLGVGYLKKHRRPHHDVYIAVWVSSGLLWTLESMVQSAFAPQFNMTTPRPLHALYNWDRVVPPRVPNAIQGDQLGEVPGAHRAR